jgi:hypothetical protein
MLNMRDELSRMGFIGENQKTKETVIKSARLGATAEIVETVRKGAQGGPTASSIAKPE